MAKKKGNKSGSNNTPVIKNVVVEEETICAPERDSDVEVLEKSGVPNWMQGVVIVSATLLTVGAFSVFLGGDPSSDDNRPLKGGLTSSLTDIPTTDVEYKEAVEYLEENKEVMQESLQKLDPVSLDIPTEYIEKPLISPEITDVLYLLKSGLTVRQENMGVISNHDNVVEVFIPDLGWMPGKKSFDCDENNVLIDKDKKRSILRYPCRYVQVDQVSMQ